MEIFIINTKRTIVLEDIPGSPRVRHTLTGNVICGGVWGGTSDNCLELKSDGTGWHPYISLLSESRMAHSSWDSPQGIVLLGGYNTGKKVEILKKQGGSVSTSVLPDFTLYDIR